MPLALTQNHVRTGFSDANGNISRPWLKWLQDVSVMVSNHGDNETPKGLVDGVNRTFTLLTAPNPLPSLQLFQRPSAGPSFLLFQGTDYTITRNTVTLVVAPPVGSILAAFYRL